MRRNRIQMICDLINKAEPNGIVGSILSSRSGMNHTLARKLIPLLVEKQFLISFVKTRRTKKPNRLYYAKGSNGLALLYHYRELQNLTDLLRRDCSNCRENDYCPAMLSGKRPKLDCDSWRGWKREQ